MIDGSCLDGKGREERERERDGSESGMDCQHFFFAKLAAKSGSYGNKQHLTFRLSSVLTSGLEVIS